MKLHTWFYVSSQLKRESSCWELCNLYIYKECFYYKLGLTKSGCKITVEMYI